MEKIVKQLPNGIKLVYDYFPGIKSFVLSITSLAGSRQDFEGKDGLAHFVEHILFRRNRDFTNSQLAREFEKTGTIYNAFTEQELTCFYLKGLNEKFEEVFNLISKFFTCPVFDKKDFEKERKIILEEIRSYEDDPEEYILDVGNELIFPNHPLGRHITGTEESLMRITIEDIQHYFYEYYAPNNLLVAFVGNIPFNQFEEIVNKKLEELKPHPIKIQINDIPQNTIPLMDIARDLEQSHFLYQMRIDNLSESELPMLKLFSYYLSESPSSLIYNSLREKSGLVYNVFTNVEQFSDTNVLQLYYATQKSNYDKAQSLLNEIFDKIKAGKLNKSLFQLSKGSLKAQHIYRLEIPYEIMMNSIRTEYLNGKYLYNNFIEEISSTKFDKFKEFTSNLLNNNKWSVVRLLQT